jgi:PAS domain S-box-containing protein
VAPATHSIPNILSRRTVLVAGIALIVVVGAATALIIWLLRAQALERAELHLDDLGAAVAEHAHQSMHSVALILSATAEEVGPRLEQGAGFSEAMIHRRLRDRVKALPHVLALTVMDRDGNLLAHSGRFPAPAVNYADREYFRAHRASGAAGPHIGEPVVGRTTGVRTYTFSLRVDGPRGEFRGLVVAAARLEYFHDFYKRLKLGPEGRVFVFRADGLFLTSYPVIDSAIGRSFADDPLFAQPVAGPAASVVRRSGFVDARARIVAFRRLADEPLVVAVSSTQDFVLAGWRADAFQIGAAGAAMTVFFGLAMLLLLRQLRERTVLKGELAEAGEQLHRIVDTAMDAIITVDEKQNIVLFNSAAEKIFRHPAAQALGQPLDRFIPERFRAAHRRHVWRFGETGDSMRVMGENLVLYGLRPDGEEFPIDASISQIDHDGGKLFTVILRDITARKQAEAEVRKQRDTAQRYLDIAGVILVALDSDGKVALINRKGCEVLGYREDEIVGQSWFDRFLPERLRQDTWNVFERIVGGERQLTEFHENPVLTRSGAERMIAWHNRALTDENGRVVGALSSGADVTERKQAEAALERSYRELRELSAAMNEVREAERTRIARELHDELAQWLTALKMDVAWLSSRLPDEQQQLIDRTEKMKGLVDTTVGAVRRIAAALRPVMLDDLGLIAATENLLHDFSQRTGVVVGHEIEDWADRLGEPLATSLYRMLQEAVTNVARHAAATEVRVTLRRENGDLVLRVQDNGRGFDAEVVARGKSYGVLGMRERAHTLGGRARIEPLMTGGTLVEIVIPYERYETGGEGAGHDSSAAG